MNAFKMSLSRRRWIAALAASMLGCSGTAGPAGQAGPAGMTGATGAQCPVGPQGPAGSSDGGSASDGGVSGPANVDQLELPGANFYPVGIGIASDGTLYVGSVTTGAVVRFAPGQTEATTFIAPGGSLTGAHCLLVDETTQSLFACSVDATLKSESLMTVQRYDLATGALRATFTFPDATTSDAGSPNLRFPNDIAFDGAHRLYVTDSFGGSVYVVADVTSDATMAAWSSDASLAPAHAGKFGATGISWDGSSSFYVDNNDTGALVKIPLNGDGTAGPATAVTVTPALTNPVGEQQLDPNTLVLVENDALIKVALSGESGTATVLDNRLDGPTSLVRFGDSYWVAEGQITTLVTGAPPNLPFLVQRVDAY
jgi:sugar lactone lactonase YvrE